jgi:hypothetical protein
MTGNSGPAMAHRRTVLKTVAGAGGAFVFAGCSGSGSEGDGGNSPKPSVTDSDQAGNTKTTGSGVGARTKTSTAPGTPFSGVEDFLSQAVSPAVLDSEDMVNIESPFLYGGNINHREFNNMRSTLDDDLEGLVLSTYNAEFVPLTIGFNREASIDITLDIGISRSSLNASEERIVEAIEGVGLERQDSSDLAEGWDLYQGEQELNRYEGPVSWAVSENQAVMVAHDTRLIEKPVELLIYKTDVIESNAPSRMERPGKYGERLSRAAGILENDSRASECVTLNVDPDSDAYLVRGLALLGDGEYEIRDWDRTEDGRVEYHLDVEPTSIRSSDFFAQ